MNGKDLSMLQPYCENDMKLLKKISRSIFMKFNEPISMSDYDEFYSLANMTLWKAYNAYDPDKDVCFEGFLHTCLQKKFKSELTRRHRKKEMINRLATSLDATDEDEDKSSLMDLIPSDFDTFEEMLKNQDKDQYQSKVQQYLSRLSNQQVNILNLLMDGYEANEIRQILDISEREYSDNLQIARSYENVKILF